MPLLFGDFFKLVLEFLLFSASGFMILLVLVQRGRGGGLTGALGGMGGQSAFGAKAGDVFTRITVVSAIIWIFLCLITIRSYSYVPVNTTAMKEYQYTKLLKDTSVSTDGDSDVSSSLNLGKNPDDGPGASLKSLDSDEDKKSGEQAEKDNDDANGSPGDDKNGASKDDDSDDKSGTPSNDKDAGKDKGNPESGEKKDDKGTGADPKSNEKKTGAPEKSEESK